MKDSPSRQNDSLEHGINPLDGYERFLKSRKARFQRSSADSMTIEVDNYSLDLYWNEDDEALHCSCALNVQLPEGIRDLAAPVVMHINRRQWLGHFEIAEDGFPCFRYTMLFHGNASTADNDVIEEMTEIATRSCGQYEAAFALMAQATEPSQFPRIFTEDGRMAALGLALLDTTGRG